MHLKAEDYCYRVMWRAAAMVNWKTWTRRFATLGVAREAVDKMGRDFQRANIDYRLVYDFGDGTGHVHDERNGRDRRWTEISPPMKVRMRDGQAVVGPANRCPARW